MKKKSLLSSPDWDRQAEKIGQKAVNEAIAGHFRAGRPVYVSDKKKIYRIDPNGRRTKINA